MNKKDAFEKFIETLKISEESLLKRAPDCEGVQEIEEIKEQVFLERSEMTLTELEERDKENVQRLANFLGRPITVIDSNKEEKTIAPNKVPEP